MKVSLNWIRFLNEQYKTAADPAPSGVDELLGRIDRQLGAVEEVIDLGRKYRGVVIVKVISCDKHPGADKLSLCQVDDGKGKPIQVVCGAPNVRAGMLAAWIPPGSIVPSTADKDPFVIEAREIRGKLSNGMLASAKELDLGDDHSGILEVDEGRPGDDFAKTYRLDDHIIDIENKMFTHRPDCFGMLGVAREIAGIQGHRYQSPDWYREGAKPEMSRARDDHKLSVDNRIPELVPRFCATVIKDIKVAPSPVWLRAWLSRVGIKPINNLVDLSNYIMYETAQPIHIYDYDKVKRLSGSDYAQLTVRHPKKGEKITVLGGKQLEPPPDSMMVAAGNHLVCVGGTIGGANSEVDDDTTNIIVEAANWDMNLIRKTSMELGIFTDAATRFTKGQSPLQNMAVIARIAEAIKDLAGGRIINIIDDNHVKTGLKPIDVTASFINQRLGEQLSTAEIKKILENVEFKVKSAGDKLSITAPFWRTDIGIPEDIVEEVGRLYGYERLPQLLPARDLAPADLNPSLQFKNQLRDLLSAAGANELLTYSFVSGRLLSAVGQDPEAAFKISNALSPDLQYYRLSLTPSLLEKVHPNIKAGVELFAIYEIGKAHIKGHLNEEKLPQELERLSLIVASNKPQNGAAYYFAKKYAEYLLNGVGIYDVAYEPLDAGDNDVATTYYEPARAATIKIAHKVIGRIGEYKPSIRRALKLPEYCAGFELGLQPIMELASPRAYEPLPKYPSLSQDLTLRIAKDISYGQATDMIYSFLEKLSGTKGYQGSVSPLDIFQKSPDAKDRQITWRLVLSHPDRTLTTTEANKILDDLSEEARQQLNAERV